MTEAPLDVLLFTYGTLQNPEVQLDTFGRLLDGEPDVLPGFTVDYVDIDVPHVVSISGHDVHPIVRATGDALDKVVGLAAWVSEEELESADEYEVELYRRVSVPLASGRQAWVYIAH